MKLSSAHFWRVLLRNPIVKFCDCIPHIAMLFVMSWMHALPSRLIRRSWSWGRMKYCNYSSIIYDVQQNQTWAKVKGLRKWTLCLHVRLLNSSSLSTEGMRMPCESNTENISVESVMFRAQSGPPEKLRDLGWLCMDDWFDRKRVQQVRRPYAELSSLPCRFAIAMPFSYERM